MKRLSRADYDAMGPYVLGAHMHPRGETKEVWEKVKRKLKRGPVAFSELLKATKGYIPKDPAKPYPYQLITRWIRRGNIRSVNND